MKKGIVIILCLATTIVPASALISGEGSATLGRQCSEVTQDLLQTSKAIGTSDMDSNPVPKDFIVWDHVGFKDAAWSGRQHVYLNKKGGVVFQGYAQNPYNDLIVSEKMTEGARISLGQVPLRADWHTLNGNGLIFGADFKDDSFSGFAVVATMTDIEVREYQGVSKSSFMNGDAAFTVLASKPKACPAQEFIVENKIVYESGALLIDLSGKTYYGNFVGAMSDFGEHNCGSLSTIYVPYLMVNEVNILNTSQPITHTADESNVPPIFRGFQNEVNT